MIDSLIIELQERLPEIENPNTLYFGGGTPSILFSEELEKIIKTISNRFDLGKFQEITLEANPEDISQESLDSWRKLGINRLSIGIQSFKESDLKWMNRAHSVEESRKAIVLAQQAGYENISLDLIYGLPQSTLEEWEKQLEEVLSWNVNHVSAYCLTVEKGTALKRYIKHGKLNLPNEDSVVEQFQLLIDKLNHAGFTHYEISNFGKGLYRAVHNSSYWKGEKYIGIGPSAHSFDGKKRRWNIANNNLYMKRQNWFEEEVLSQKELWNEHILTGLRTTEGVYLPQLYDIMQPDSNFLSMKKKFIESKWLIELSNQIYLSQEGKLRADYIASEFFRV